MIKNYTCSECKNFIAGAPGHEGTGRCCKHNTEVWCGTNACNLINLKPIKH